MTGGTPVPAPGADLEFSDIPYAGLFGDTVIARVVEEIIADPHSTYRPRDLEELTEASSPRVRDALVTLTKFGLLKSAGGKHPTYTVDKSKKTFVALTLLAYATLDDRQGSDCMNTALQHYCETVLPCCLGGQAVASTTPYRISSGSGILSPVITVGTGNAYHYLNGVATQD
ncbi:MAG: hypothetical protein ABFC71_01665 [Methanoregula sp.]